MKPKASDRNNDLTNSVAPGSEASHCSQLFTVRLWPEELGNGRVEWRGRVQHVTSGQWRYFREWPALVAALQEMLTAGEEETESTEQPIGQEGTRSQGKSPGERS